MQSNLAVAEAPESGVLRANFSFAIDNESKMLVVLKPPVGDPMIWFGKANPSFVIPVQGSAEGILEKMKEGLTEAVKKGHAKGEFEFSPVVLIYKPDDSRNPVFQLTTNGSMTAEQLVHRMGEVFQKPENQQALDSPKLPPPDIKLV